MDIETIARNIITFYTTSDNTIRKNAEKILTNFQKTPKAWQICKAFLESKNLGDNANAVLLFSTSTISTKIIFQLSDLDAESAELLKNFLFNKILEFSGNERLTTVCSLMIKSIANLTILTCKKDEEMLILRLAEALFEKNPDIMLKLLWAIPFEFKTLKQRHSFVIPAAQFDNIEKHVLDSSAVFVLTLLERMHSLQKAQTSSILECYACWMELASHKQLTATYLESCVIVDLSLQRFLDGQNLEDCFSIIYRTLTSMDSTTHHKNTILSKKLVKFLLKLASQISLYFDKQIDFDGEWDLGSLLEKSCKLFAESCKSFFDLILEGEKVPLKILKVAIDSLRIQSRVCNSITLDFLFNFFTLLELFYKHNSDAALKNLFDPIIHDTMRNLVQSCSIGQYDATEDFLLEESFLAYREDVFSFCSFMATMANPKILVENLIREEFGADWDGVFTSKNVAGFFVVSALSTHREVEPLFEKTISPIVQSAMKPTSIDHYGLCESINLILSNFTPKIKNDPHFFQKCLDFLIWQINSCNRVFPAFKNNFSFSVAITFESFCYKCTALMVQRLPLLNSLFSKFPALSQRAHRNNFINGICHVFSFIENANDFKQGVSSLFNTCFGLIQSQSTVDSRVLIAGVDGIAWLVHCVNARDIALKPCLDEMMRELLNSLWNRFLERFILDHYKNEKIVESALSKLCKYFARDHSEIFKPFVPKILNSFVAIMQKDRIPSGFLYLGSIFVEVYYKDSDFVSKILTLFSEYVLAIVGKDHSDATSDDYVFMVEDYFRLCYKILNFRPELMLNSVYFDKIFLLAIKELGIEDHTSFEMICGYIKRIIKMARKTLESSTSAPNAAFLVINAHSVALINRLVFCVYHHREKFISDICEIFAFLENLNSSGLKVCVEKALETEIPQFDGDVKRNFLEIFLQTKSFDGKLLSLKQFHGMCQLHFINTSADFLWRKPLWSRDPIPGMGKVQQGTLVGRKSILVALFLFHIFKRLV